MVTIKTDANTEVERVIAAELIRETDFFEWYTQEHIETVLDTRPFVLLEFHWSENMLPLLIEISEKHPDVIFTIRCNTNSLRGWVRYITRGKTQLCLPYLEYDSFNPKELKTLEEEGREREDF